MTGVITPITPSIKAAALFQSQSDWAAHLRAPNKHPRPAATDARAMRVYRGLLRNGVASFLYQCFPVMRSILTERQFERLIDDFFEQARCYSPWFQEIPLQFAEWLENKDLAAENLPPYLAQLADYEYVELAVDIAPDITAAHTTAMNTDGPTLNPSLVLKAYTWPVQTISVKNPRPEISNTFIAVYRNRDFRVRFTVLSPASAQLLHLMQENACSWAAATERLAQLLGASLEMVEKDTRALRQQFINDQLIYP